MILLDDKSKCCGCGKCENTCPKRAIKMIEDEYGFKYPKIDDKLCIDCGLCKKQCFFKNENKNIVECKKAYAAISKDYEIIKKSASGGIFASIAKAFLKNNGIVYGCTMNYRNNKLTVEHIRVDNEIEIEKLQGSKYIQSNINDCYQSIKKDLKSDKIVLFSGTPCQVDAIRSYLKNENVDKLYCMDIICHGVPSNKMFNEYIDILEKKSKAKVVEFNFRDKTKNWGLNASMIIKNFKGKIKKILIPAYNSSFYQLFLDAEIYRECCYKCPYANKKRVGDITIGDFWKVESEHSNKIKKEKIDINNGVSCILVNTIKGEKLLNTFGENLKSFESDFKKISKHNMQLVQPSEIRNKKFYMDIYIRGGYGLVDKYYKKNNWKKIIIKKCWYKLPLKIRNRIKK